VPHIRVTSPTVFNFSAEGGAPGAGSSSPAKRVALMDFVDRNVLEFQDNAKNFLRDGRV
jgi:hypothetical protein